MAISYDLVIPVGDTWRSPRWALVIGDEVIDLADGWTVKAQVRSYRQAPTTLHQWTTGDGVELGTATFDVGGDEVTGATARLHLTAAESTTLAGMTGVWDLEVSHPTWDDGALYRKTLITGRVRTEGEVSR